MPLSPASSKHEPSDQQRQEELQRQCATNGNQGDSDSSREDAVYDTIRAAAAAAESPPAGPMEEPRGNTVVIRIGIPDLQQTFSPSTNRFGMSCYATPAVRRDHLPAFPLSVQPV
ncbi:hypothetical protein SKAU_G00022460 [Synaphobranchus kaupii]|uniref:Uncharacterized protein n=1 Tax=Synaphobranchus kaupii TaxID=118154 RepID=A0A9Q1GDB5_SYNKA|nr:hypothetical protein SKAU_G00022460 [Synaphobranchus kaupii]